MTNTTFSFRKLAMAGAAVIGASAALLAPATASAAQVSGVATITIDNPSVMASNPGDWYFETHWGTGDESLLIDGSTTGGNVLSTTSSTDLLFSINPNSTTVVTSTAGYGRTLQATTMDATNTTTGQIGLNGALRMRDAGGSIYLSPYDLRLVKTDGAWLIQAYDTGFQYSGLFQISNATESLDGTGNLLLDGDLTWATIAGPGGFATWKSLLGADSSLIGHFSLASSAAPVPVPAAAWLFGGALTGLFGVVRRRKGGTIA